MTTQKNAIAIMDALRGRSLPHPGGRVPLLVIDDRPLRALEALRAIGDALDATVELIEGSKTNLNDLEHRLSPLRRLVDGACDSSRRHLFVFFGVAEMTSDRRMSALFSLIGSADLVMVVPSPAPNAAKAPPESFGWASCDLRPA